MTSINHRKQKRMYYARMGSRTALVGGILFFVLLFVTFFLSFDSPIWNWVAASTHITYFGIIFAVLFGRVGWSKNRLIDFFFNQMSIWLFVIGAIAIIVNNFVSLHFIIGNAGVSFMCAGIVMALLGVIFKTNEEAANSLDS